MKTKKAFIKYIEENRDFYWNWMKQEEKKNGH